MPLQSPQRAWHDAGRLGRCESIGTALTAVGAAAAFVGGVYAKNLLLMSILPIAWVLLMQVLRKRRYRLVRRRVAANRGAVCWQCWYPLKEIDADRCPECGTPFDREALRLAWTKALYPR